MQQKTVKSSSNKVRLLIQGPSGSGKTYTALLLAYGLCGNPDKIAIIDTHSSTICLYGSFSCVNLLSLSAPLTWYKFNDAIELCEQTGIEVLIIDSVSADCTGNSNMLTSPKVEDSFYRRYNLIIALDRIKCHLIATQCTEQCDHLSILKEDYIVDTHTFNLHQQGVTPDRFHTILSLDMAHKAKSIKDRTSFFNNHNSIVVTDEIAADFAEWWRNSVTAQVVPELPERINGCKSLKELLELMYGCNT